MTKDLYPNSNQNSGIQQNQNNSHIPPSSSVLQQTQSQTSSTQVSSNPIVSTVNSYIAEIQRLTTEVKELKTKLAEREDQLRKFTENKEYYISILKKSIGSGGIV